MNPKTTVAAVVFFWVLHGFIISARTLLMKGFFMFDGFLRADM